MTARLRSLAWGTFALICALDTAGAVFGWLTRMHSNTGSWGTGGIVPSLAFVVTTFMFPLVGVLLATRRPGNRIAWILLAVGVIWSLDSLASTYATYSLVLHHGSRSAGRVSAGVDNVLWLPAIGLTGTFLILFFPDGHLPGRRWRWVGWLAGLTIAVGAVSILLDPSRMSDSPIPTAENPFGIEAIGAVVSVSRAAVALLPVAILCSAASLVVRYRRSRGADRLQLKWLAAAAAAVAGLFGLVMIFTLAFTGPQNAVPAWLQTLQDAALFSFALIPVSIGFAVFRYRLYDIDIIIRRTLVYALLVGSLASVYLAGIALIGVGLRTVTGRSGGVAVTLSTLAVAAAFQPLRERIQGAVDRRFYRGRYDAARMLAQFNSTLREQLDLDALRGEVLDIVHETVRPHHAELWLRPPAPGERRREARLVL